MRRFLYDTAVFVYAVGGEHRYRDPCRDIVTRAQRGELDGEASVQLIQEFVHVRARRAGDRAEALRLGGAVASLCHLHDFERRDLPLAMRLLAEHAELGVADAVHATTAINRGVDAILSPDRAFDAVPGLERVDPTDRAGVDALAR